MPSRLIESLHPQMQPLVRVFLERCRERGIELLVTSTWRSFEEQAALWAIGRTIPGRKVTNARAGESFHNVKRAVDVVPVVAGKAIWNTPLWEEIGEVGERAGLEWGGHFRSIQDKPHFQWAWCETHGGFHAKATAFGETGICNG